MSVWNANEYEAVAHRTGNIKFKFEKVKGS